MSSQPSRRQRRRVIALTGALALAFAGAISTASADDGDGVQPVPFTHNNIQAPAPVAGSVFGSGSATKQGVPICSTPTQTGADANTDCGITGPHNETSIAVNPTNPMNMIGGVNDYQLGINPGGHVTESIQSRAHVTTDGGKTWTLYPIHSDNAYQATGDPSVAFDATGHAYYATLGFRFVGPTKTTAPDVVVSNSADGGRTWSTAVVARGSGNTGSVGDYLDKEYVAAWGNGNAIVTYGDFRDGQKGSFVSAKIYSSVTHDFGKTWTTPRVISGELDEAFVSVPTVGPDGSIAVAFLNTTDLQTGRDDYEVVRVDPATGAALNAPVKVATTIDGFTDYPIAGGRQTYQDSAFRSWAAGNITADPTRAGHLAVVWSDMRNSVTPAPSDPYLAKTNSDVVVSQSFDGGASWSAPVALAAPGDQFQPWGAYDAQGLLRIGTFDRSQDPANHTYNYSLATESSAGSLSFGAWTPVSTVPSDPTTGDRWFAATINPSFPRATLFLGDYSNIAATPSGGVVAYWTDLRNQACFAGGCGHGEDAYFAAVN